MKENRKAGMLSQLVRASLFVFFVANGDLRLVREAEPYVLRRDLVGFGLRTNLLALSPFVTND